MITEFTCGIYTAAFVNTKWRLTANNHHICWIEQDGLLLQFATIMRFSQDDLIEIAVLMNNIKRQYKQLQTTDMHKSGNIYLIDGTFNLLSQFQLGGIDHAVLISLDGHGNRWVNPVQVADMRHITDSEMDKLAGSKAYELWEGPLTINKHK